MENTSHHNLVRLTGSAKEVKQRETAQDVVKRIIEDRRKRAAEGAPEATASERVERMADFHREPAVHTNSELDSSMKIFLDSTWGFLSPEHVQRIEITHPTVEEPNL